MVFLGLTVVPNTTMVSSFLDIAVWAPPTLDAKYIAHHSDVPHSQSRHNSNLLGTTTNMATCSADVRGSQNPGPPAAANVQIFGRHIHVHREQPC
jgi:hypothetical protein